VTASFSPTSIATSTLSSATLTLTSAYSASTYIGSSTVTVTGTSGGVMNSAIFTLTTQPLQYKGYCGVQ
jgi:fucose permease